MFRLLGRTVCSHNDPLFVLECPASNDTRSKFAEHGSACRSVSAMKNKRVYLAIAAVLVLIPLALLARTFSASPLPKPEPYAGPVPSATPPKELAVLALVTGVNHRVAAFGYRGGSLFEPRDFSMAGTLVKHPQGDLLIDTGFGRNIDEQFRTMPWRVRAITFYDLWQPAVDQLRAASYDQNSLRAILLTHSHWDH